MYRSGALLAISLVVWALSFARPVIAADITLFPVPETTSAYPNQLTVGPDRNIWFTETNVNKVARIDPAAPNMIEEFALPTASDSPFYIIPGPDGNLWFATSGSVRYLLGGTNGSVGRILANGTHAVEEFPLSSATSTSGIIVVGPDRNIWFTDGPGQGAPPGTRSKIGRLDPVHPGTTDEFPMPANFSFTAMVAGHQNDIWIAGIFGPRKSGVLGRLRIDDPSHVKLIPIPGAGAFVYGGVFSLIWGPDGNLWFSQFGSISRYTPNVPRSFSSVPINASQIIGLAVGPDDNIWFAEANNGTAALNRMTVRYPNYITQFVVPGSATVVSPQRIVAGPDGNIWATIATNDGVTPGYIAELLLPH